MAINYRRLWKLLIDKNMKKCDLQEKAGLSSSTIAKLGKNEAVMSDVIDRICLALDCRKRRLWKWNMAKLCLQFRQHFKRTRNTQLRRCLLAAVALI